MVLQAAFDVSQIETRLPEICGEYKQLLAFGHCGSRVWRQIDQPLKGKNLLDSRSISIVKGFLRRIKLKHYEIVYPFEVFHINLRALGKQLGWYSDSSLGIGFNAIFGTWSAFRVFLLADTAYEIRSNRYSELKSVHLKRSPCELCADKARAGACPIGIEYLYSSDQQGYHDQQSLELIQ